jgi:regulator of sirC expression with transglutaminase-like and TPR domain
MTEEDCRALLLEMYKGQLEYRPEFLRRARNREILERMLNNLKGIYQQRREFNMALKIQQLVLCLEPDRPDALRDRGLIHYRLALIAEAVADLDRYLSLAPDAPDAPQIRTRLDEMKRLVPQMN